jgi:hypothetical protein
LTQQKYKENYAKTKKACSFHEKNTGCVIKELRMPVCISFSCLQQEYELEKTYNILYHSSSLTRKLEFFLFGEEKEKTILHIQEKIQKATKRINLYQEGKIYEVLKI